MSFIDRMAEEHILAAQRRGELDNLKGSGKPLCLDDDSVIPAELRAAYRLLKNAGYLPPELEARREALELSDLLRSANPQDAVFQQQLKRLSVLELKLQQAGMNTDFLHGSYIGELRHHFSREE